jgi:F0F1-type ATP synthase membrane subunit b/b'
MDILHSLGQLFLESVPTIIIVLLFYVFLRSVFFTPIQRAMAEREARIDGARAEAAVVEAEAKHEMESYHDRLRQARATIFSEQETVRREALENRAKLLKALRVRAQEEVLAATKRIEAESQAARAQVEREAPTLAGAIVRVILEKRSSLGGGVTR